MSELTRVALLSYHTCPLAALGGKKTGGMNVYVRDFARALASTGVHVDVFTRMQEDCSPQVDHDLGFGARVIHIPAGPIAPMPVSDMVQFVDDFADGILDFVAAEGCAYDVIHSHYWLSGLAGIRLRAAWPGVPLIHMFHTLGHMKNAIARDERERAPQARLDGETQVVHAVDRLIAATPAEHQQLVALYGADPATITVIPPGVDLRRFRPMDQESAKQFTDIPVCHKNILYAGRIESLKGIDTLLRALALLHERQPDKLGDVCVTIIGGNPWADTLDAEMARLHRLRAQLGLHDLVTFAGSRDQDVLPYHYAAAEMVVMPSHYESFGMVALESMAMGTPVVASDVGGLAHLVKDGYNGYLVPAGDAEALAARILDVLDCDGCREQLGAQAQRYAQGFDWCNIVEKMLAVYADR